MSESLGFLPPLLFIGAILVGIYAIGRYFEKKRIADLKTFAETRGFAFAETNQIIAAMPFHDLVQGRDQAITAALTIMRNDVELTVFDHKYVTGHGKNRRTNKHTLVLVRTPGRPAPLFYARRQLAFLDRIGKMLGGQDINFPDDKPFSDAYVLQTKGDEGEVRRFMTPQLRAALTRLKDKRMSFEAMNDTFLIDHNRRVKVHELDQFLAAALTLRTTWS